MSGSFSQDFNNDFDIGTGISHGPKIVNGWYVDSKGGLHYYYRYADGTPANDPPRAT